jgi:hypothetical protein
VDAVEKYLARYAEPEAEIARSIPGSYGAALIVPACQESIALLDGYREAALGVSGRLLVILVVNAGLEANVGVHTANQALLAALGERFPDAERLDRSDVSFLPPARLANDSAFDLLWVDRASQSFRLPEQQGVGLARRIGTDIALGLYRAGKLGSPWLFGSDADAVLPSDYFKVQGDPDAAALLYPFVHVPGGDPDIDQATQLYEISLRYYTLGLAWAGSPYAYHSIGSTFAVGAESYAMVRGFPKRTAGEDFYLLDKLAKLGPLCRVSTEPVRIISRRSERVPFGTGRRVAEIALLAQEGSEQKLYNPEVFSGLNSWLTALERFVSHRDVAELKQELGAARAGLGQRALGAAESLGALDELALAARQSPKAAVLRRRLHTWFDALRTLRLIHGLRDSGSIALPYREALGIAPFTAEVAQIDAPDELARSLAKLELRLGRRVGVTV